MLEKEIAEKKVALYANLTDEQFTDISTDLVEAAKKKKEEKKPADDGGCASATEILPVVEDPKIDDKVLDSAVPIVEPALSTDAGVVDETADLRKDLQKALAERLGIELEQNK